MMLQCDDCGHIFDEEDARRVLAGEEDCVPRGTYLDACPVCRSTAVYEVEGKRCIRCGGIAEEGSDYCEFCKDDLWG